MAVEISPNRVRYVCKAPGCEKEFTYNTMRMHMSQNPEHKAYSFKAVISEEILKEAAAPEEEDTDEGPTVVEGRTETVASTEPPKSVTSTTRAIKPATVTPLTLAKISPEPTYFNVKVKLPVSLYQYYDIVKPDYSGDFSDFVAEAAIDGIIAAMREYCEECGGKIDKCPHCQADLPLVELAMVVRK